jgi:hypothetical protein
MLAASVAFYAPEHPMYWSLWNMAVETPWVDSGNVASEGGVIVCDRSDDKCQALAESWSADRGMVSVAKSERGFQFDAQAYAVYWLAPQARSVAP